MVNTESGSGLQNEDDLIRQVSGFLSELAGVGDVRLEWGGSNAMFQSFLRVTTDAGRVYRFAISYVEDEESVEYFDEAFSG